MRVRHVLRHATLPALTLSGWAVGYLFSGAVLVETVFARPGIGSVLVTATGDGDVPVVEIDGTVVKDVHTSLTPAKLRSQILKEVKRVVTLRTAPTNTPALAG